MNRPPIRSGLVVHLKSQASLFYKRAIKQMIKSQGWNPGSVIYEAWVLGQVTRPVSPHPFSVKLK